MKKCIDGKIYNTETATKIGHTSSNCGRNDFRYYYEELYKTKKGRYFLAGEGGAMTKYSRSCGNNSQCGGEDIIPLTSLEAREWAEEADRLEDEIENLFDVEEA